MTLRTAVFCLMGCAAVSALLLSIRSRRHAPVAALLVVNILAGLLRVPLQSHHDAPWLLHLNSALYLLDPASIAAAALAVFVAPAAALLATPPWLLLCVGLALEPPLDEGGLRAVYLAAELVGLLAGFGAMAWWLVRVRARNLPEMPRVALWRRVLFVLRFVVRSAPEKVAMALVLTNELMNVVAGAWRYGLWERWDLALWCQSVLYVLLTAGQAWVVRDTTRVSGG